jgi:hypothetical protein
MEFECWVVVCYGYPSIGHGHGNVHDEHVYICMYIIQSNQPYYVLYHYTDEQ